MNAAINFTAALETWLVKAQASVDSSTWRKGQKLSLESGRRYVRVVIGAGNDRSVYGFIDATNGDILKAASWKTPAKGARGNIYREESTGFGPNGFSVK